MGGEVSEHHWKYSARDLVYVTDSFLKKKLFSVAALQSAGAKQTLGIIGAKAGGVVAAVDSYLRASK